MDSEPDSRVTLTTGRTISLGEEKWDIRDAGVPVSFADIITEARQINGVVYISLASGIADEGNKGVADITHRIRLSLGSAQFLHNVLGDLIKQSLAPPIDPSKAN